MFLIFVLVIRPLVYTVSALLPAAYIIGLTFTLKTHSHIYDIQVGEGQGMCLLHSQRPSRDALIWPFTALLLCAVTGNHGAVVHWSRWRSLVILVVATVLTSACADLVTENIQPILNQPNVSQVRSPF